MFIVEGKDKKGRQLFWYRPDMLKKSEGAQQRERNKKLTVYLFEKMDRQYTNEGWYPVVDASRMTKDNVDMDFYLFCLNIYMVYYPRSVKYLIGMYIPSALDEFVKTLMDLMDDELKNRIKFLKYKELTDNYVDAKFVPLYVPRT